MWISHREASLIVPPGSENERVSCVLSKNLLALYKRGASSDIHASSCNTSVANLILYSRSICACVLASD